MPANLQFFLNINNRTSEHVTFSKVDLTYGSEDEDHPHVGDIPPQHSVTTALDITGDWLSVHGVQGTVYYQVGTDPGATFNVYFEIPLSPGSKNTVTLNASESVNARLDGWNGGSSETVNVTAIVSED